MIRRPIVPTLGCNDASRDDPGMGFYPMNRYLVKLPIFEFEFVGGPIKKSTKPGHIVLTFTDGNHAFEVDRKSVTILEQDPPLPKYCRD